MLGAAANRVPLRRIWAAVVLTVVGFALVTIVMQSVGWAPAMRVVR